jgi:hypothetical protein
MLPVITIMPRRSGVPAAASFPASQASAFNGLPFTSRPTPLPISRPLINSRAVARAKSRARHSMTGIPSRVLRDMRRHIVLAQISDKPGHIIGLVGTERDPVIAGTGLHHLEPGLALCRAGGAGVLAAA